MRELSLHILDVVTNSIEAGASRVILWIDESVASNLLSIRVRDNGRGMTREMIERVMDPFVTTRTTRPVGMGLPLLQQAARSCGGDLEITSAPGEGTTLRATFALNSLNRAPLGDIAATVVNLIIGAPDVHFVYVHQTDSGHFSFDSYWIYARMAERDCSQYELVTSAQIRIQQGLQQIGAIG
ncbi:MAG TPA: ATP-binding protein [bacterium]|nr:ATP-binding protein [bacterium]HQG46087.1 ATP-binding protein [bacterium]HQI49324.1 ATP-binding protein [bacterium]HQJ64700.1 ATP-binding protein [bacterium]